MFVCVLFLWAFSTTHRRSCGQGVEHISTFINLPEMPGLFLLAGRLGCSASHIGRRMHRLRGSGWGKGGMDGEGDGLGKGRQFIGNPLNTHLKDRGIVETERIEGSVHSLSLWDESGNSLNRCPSSWNKRKDSVHLLLLSFKELYRC